ncbi:MAG: hypothetical protein KIG60_08490 [Caryophanon sp.]|nr:hypothetical protein [Caryophanon sp.]
MQALLKNTFIVLFVAIGAVIGLLVGIFWTDLIPASLALGAFFGGVLGVIADAFTGRDHRHWKKA